MTTDTIIMWSGAALALVGALIAAVALGADWARRQHRGRTRRCPRCWYDMSGTTGLLCPECGRTARSERRLLKSRRRWRWAGVGFLILLAGAGGAAWPRLSRADWVKTTPGFVLVRMVEDTTPIVQPQTPGRLPGRNLPNLSRAPAPQRRP